MRLNIHINLEGLNQIDLSDLPLVTPSAIENAETFDEHTALMGQLIAHDTVERVNQLLDASVQKLKFEIGLSDEYIHERMDVGQDADNFAKAEKRVIKSVLKDSGNVYGLMAKILWGYSVEIEDWEINWGKHKPLAVAILSGTRNSDRQSRIKELFEVLQDHGEMLLGEGAFEDKQYLTDAGNIALRIIKDGIRGEYNRQMRLPFTLPQSPTQAIAL